MLLPMAVFWLLLFSTSQLALSPFRSSSLGPRTPALVNAAQNEFYRFDQFDQSYTLRNLFSFDGSIFPKDVVDDGSVQRVVTILQTNIKQWNFIESQLLEPNVNLQMPEIFIPLRHLTTTLEVLGNILFMRDELMEAKGCLERACPLMELLPSNINEDQRLASGCFALLREVYAKLYGPDGSNSNNPSSLLSDHDEDSSQENSARHKSSFSKKRHRRINTASRPVTLGRVKKSLLHKMTGGGADSLSDDDDHAHGSESENTLKRSSKFQDSHHNHAIDEEDVDVAESDHSSSRDADEDEEEEDGDSNYNSDRDDDENEAELDPDGVSNSDLDEDTGRYRRRARRGSDLDHDQDEENDEEQDGDEDRYSDQPFSLEARLEELRMPFDHLRIALHQQDDYDALLFEDGLRHSSPSADGIPSAIPRAVKSRKARIHQEEAQEYVKVAALLNESDGAGSLGLREEQWRLIYRFAVEDLDGRREILKHAMRQGVPPPILQDEHENDSGLGFDIGDIHGLKEFVDDPDLASAFLSVVQAATQDRQVDLSAGIENKIDDNSDSESFADNQEACSFVSSELREYIDAEGGSYSDQEGFIEFDFPGVTANLEPAEKARIAILAAFDRVLNDDALAPEGRRRRHERILDSLSEHDSMDDDRDYDSEMPNLFESTPILNDFASAHSSTIRGEEFILATLGLLLAALIAVAFSSYQEVQRRKTRTRVRTPKRSLEIFFWTLLGRPIPTEEEDMTASDVAGTTVKNRRADKVVAQGNGDRGGAKKRNDRKGGPGAKSNGKKGGKTAQQAGRDSSRGHADDGADPTSTSNNYSARDSEDNDDSEEDDDKESSDHDQHRDSIGSLPGKEGRGVKAGDVDGVAFTAASWQQAIRATSYDDDDEQHQQQVQAWSSVKSKTAVIAQRKTAHSQVVESGGITIGASATNGSKTSNDHGGHASSAPAAGGSVGGFTKPAPATHGRPHVVPRPPAHVGASSVSPVTAATTNPVPTHGPRLSPPVSKASSWASLAGASAPHLPGTDAKSKAIIAESKPVTNHVANNTIQPSVTLVGSSESSNGANILASAAKTIDTSLIGLHGLGDIVSGQTSSAKFGESDHSMGMTAMPALGLSLDLSALGVGFRGLWGSGPAPLSSAMDGDVGGFALAGIEGRNRPVSSGLPIPSVQQPYSSLYNPAAQPEYTPFVGQPGTSIMYMQPDTQVRGPAAVISKPSTASVSEFDNDILTVDSGLSANAPSFNPSSSTLGLYGGSNVVSGVGLGSALRLPAGLVPSAHTSINLPPSTLIPNTALADLDFVSIVLKVHAKVMPASQTRAVKVISATFGGWDLDSALPMHRSLANQELWGLAFQVPRGSTRFVYKYGIVDQNGVSYEEVGHARTIMLQSAVIGQDVQVEDFVEQAVRVF